MKLNRKLVLFLSLVLSLALATGGTLAYLSDTDADVNTMTLGNVYITQNEQEWNADDTALQPFTQDKPLLPYVGKLGWESDETLGDEYRRFTMENVVDKYVTVTNTGKSDAYVRTIIALEMGEYASIDEYKYDIIGTSTNAANGAEYKFDGTWIWDEAFVAEIGGKNFMVMVATHQNALAPEETTIPSLLQVYLNKECGNEEVAKVDGNGDGKLNILVLSQAVQTAGFQDAKAALNTAFGEVPANVDTWFSGNLDIGTPGEDWPNNNPPIIPEDATVVTNLEELKKAFADKESLIYVEEGTYAFGGNYSIPAGTTIFGMGEDVKFTGTLTSTLKDLTIENVKFSGSNTLRWAYPAGTVTFKNCEFTPSGVYAIHFDGTNGDVTFEDCTINGWAAMAGGSGHLTFKGCTINGDGSYGVLRCFIDADVIDCTFDVDNVNKNDAFQDGLHAVGCTIEVKNCTNVNGTMEDLVNVSDGGVINIQ